MFGFPSNVDKSMRKRFVRYRVRVYKKTKWNDLNLSEYYLEDFALFNNIYFA